jgi:penicillin-binding protein 1A
LAQRQAGSSFKPFVYLTAMEQGHTPDQMVVDEPITIGNWEPHNYTNKYLGPMTLETAFAQSINTVAAKLGSDIGTQNVAATAHRLGLTSTIQTSPSMALGAVEVTPLEMAQAYDSFANGGLAAKAYGIERIRTASGKVLFDHSLGQPPKSPVIGQPALSYMIQLMRQVLISGTGVKAKIPDYDLAGKTGTTSDYRDAWFVGYTGGFTAAVWTGRDDNTPMKRVTGGAVPAEIWRQFMSASLPRLGVQTIPGANPVPPGPASIDAILSGSGQPAAQPSAAGAAAEGEPPPG